ncbi:HsdM family class I SAM-dependent methyltransferase [Kribbella sp. NPDC002412]
MSDDLVRARTARLFDAFWSGGVSNPLEIVEQISHLLYLQELDRLQNSMDRQSASPEDADREPIFAEDEQHLRWFQLMTLEPQLLFTTMSERVFPWLRSHEFAGVPYSYQMQDARFRIPTPRLLARVMHYLDEVSADNESEAAGLYDHLLARIDESGAVGAFQTPPHLSSLLVALAEPGDDDEVCDPTCGMGGLLIAAGQFVRGSVPNVGRALHGFDLDSTMLRLTSMRMTLNRIEAPDLRRRDNLSEAAAADSGRFPVVVSRPPFGGRVDLESVAPELLLWGRPRSAEILHIAAILRLLKPGGRAAVMVPAGLLFNSSAAHVGMRRALVDEHGLEAVIAVPSGTFRPSAGLRTAILVFVKGAGRAESVWFYDLKADGWSLDSRRAPLLPADKLGLAPHGVLDTADHARNNLPDLMRRWRLRHEGERRRTRSEQSFCVTGPEIADADYNLTSEHFRHLDQMQQAAQDGIRLGDFAQVFSGSVRSAEMDKEAVAAELDVRKRVLPPSLLSSALPEVAELPTRMDGREAARPLRQGDVIGRDLAGVRHWTSVPGEYEGVQPGQGLIVIRLTEEAFPAEYLIAYLSSPYAEQQLPKYGTIPRVKAREMADIWIPKCDGDLSEIRSAFAMLEEGEQEAAHIQEELRRARNRIFESGSGSDRRARLDEAAARSSLTGQSLRRQNDPYKLFQESYPYGIARAVRKFRHSLSPTEKHEAAMQCAESLILSLGIVALALATDRGRHDLPAISQWRESVNQRGVSLGHWVGVIRAVADDARQRGESAGGLAEAMRRKKGGQGLSSDLDGLVTVRNKIRHGAAPRTRAELERSLELIEPLMLNSLEGSTFLADTRWVYADRLQWVPATGTFRVSGLGLMGDHPDFAVVSFDTTHPVVDDSLYLVAASGAPVALSPFCLLGDCPTCLAPELFYPDRMGASTALLKSLDRGHELDSDSVFTALREWAMP